MTNWLFFPDSIRFPLVKEIFVSLGIVKIRAKTG